MAKKQAKTAKKEIPKTGPGNPMWNKRVKPTAEQELEIKARKEEYESYLETVAACYKAPDKAPKATKDFLKEIKAALDERYTNRGQRIPLEWLTMIKFLQTK